MNNFAHDPQRQMLRHTVATIAYRGGKTLLEAPDGFETFHVAETTRTPVQILAHIGDLFDWALWLIKGAQTWHASVPLPWSQEVERFFSVLEQFDTHLASDAIMQCPAERLFQGPIADALTHVGQLAMLRRLAGAPVRGENYYKAEIAAGHLRSGSSTARTEFD